MVQGHNIRLERGWQETCIRYVCFKYSSCSAELNSYQGLWTLCANNASVSSCRICRLRHPGLDRGAACSGNGYFESMLSLVPVIWLDQGTGACHGIATWRGGGRSSTLPVALLLRRGRAAIRCVFLCVCLQAMGNSWACKSYCIRGSISSWLG